MKLVRVDHKNFRLELDGGAELHLDDDDVFNLHVAIHQMIKYPPAVQPEYYGDQASNL